MVQTVSNKIDDLFSPKRLRKNWRRSEETVNRPDNAEAEDQNALHIFAQLKRLIEEQFQGDNAATLNLFLEGLRALLVQRFPEAGEVPEEPDALDLEIHEALNQIEDLVEAFEIGNLSR